MKKDHRNLKDATLEFPMYEIHMFISNWFFVNQPNEICSHLSEKASQKGGFLSPRSSKITETKKKGKEKKKERGEERRRGEKSNGKIALLVFITATLEIVFGRKKLLDAKRSIWR